MHPRCNAGTVFGCFGQIQCRIAGFFRFYRNDEGNRMGRLLSSGRSMLERSPILRGIRDDPREIRVATVRAMGDGKRRLLASRSGGHVLSAGSSNRSSSWPLLAGWSSNRLSSDDSLRGVSCFDGDLSSASPSRRSSSTVLGAGRLSDVGSSVAEDWLSEGDKGSSSSFSFESSAALGIVAGSGFVAALGFIAGFGSGDSIGSKSDCS